MLIILILILILILLLLLLLILILIHQPNPQTLAGVGGDASCVGLKIIFCQLLIMYVPLH